MQQQLQRLKKLEARVDALTSDMEQETLRQRPIVSAFVTFKCALRPWANTKTLRLPVSALAVPSWPPGATIGVHALPAGTQCIRPSP